MMRGAFLTLSLTPTNAGAAEPMDEAAQVERQEETEAERKARNRALEAALRKEAGGKLSVDHPRIGELNLWETEGSIHFGDIPLQVIEQDRGPDLSPKKLLRIGEHTYEIESVRIKFSSYPITLRKPARGIMGLAKREKEYTLHVKPDELRYIKEADFQQIVEKLAKKEATVFEITCFTEEPLTIEEQMEFEREESPVTITFAFVESADTTRVVKKE